MQYQTLLSCGTPFSTIYPMPFALMSKPPEATKHVSYPEIYSKHANVAVIYVLVTLHAAFVYKRWAIQLNEHITTGSISTNHSQITNLIRSETAM